MNEASMNISMNGNDATEVAELVKLLQNAGMPQASPVSDIPMPGQKALPAPHDGHDEMKSMMSIMAPSAPSEGGMSDCGCDEADCGCDEGVEEDWENSPEEEYKDHKYMTQDLAGGINRPKKSYKPAAKGDNPMALESIKDELYAALSEFATLSEKKATEGRGKVMAGRGRGKKK